jgi:hypothetical protein
MRPTWKRIRFDALSPLLSQAPIPLRQLLTGGWLQKSSPEQCHKADKSPGFATLSHLRDVVFSAIALVVGFLFPGGPAPINGCPRIAVMDNAMKCGKPCACNFSSMPKMASRF